MPASWALPRLRDGPWYSFGSGDMLEVAHMGIHVAQMTLAARALPTAFDAVTANAATILGLEGYGLAPGCHADSGAAGGRSLRGEIA